eukprot:341194_1
MDKAMKKMNLQNVITDFNFKLTPTYFFIQSGITSGSRICMFLAATTHEEEIKNQFEDTDNNAHNNTSRAGQMWNSFKSRMPSFSKLPKLSDLFQKTDKSADEHKLDFLQMQDSEKIDLSLGFGAKLILQPLLKNEVTIDVLIRKVEDSYMIAFSLKDIELHEKIKVMQCQGIISKDEIVINGSCRLFSVDLKCKVQVDKTKIFTCIQSKIINFGNVLAEIWPNCPGNFKTELTSVEMRNFKFTFERERNENSEQNENNCGTMTIAAQIDIANLWNSLLKAIKLDIILNQIKIDFTLVNVFLKPGKKSKFPIEVKIDDVSNKQDVGSDISKRLKKFEEKHEDQFVFGFQAKLTLEPLFNESDIAVLIIRDQEKSALQSIKQMGQTGRYTQKLQLLLSEIKLHDKLIIKQAEAFITEKLSYFAGQVTVFGLDLKAQVLIQEKCFLASIKTDEIKLNKVMKEIWNGCPNGILKSLSKIDIKQFELMLQYMRGNNAETASPNCKIMIKAKMDFNAVFNSFSESMGLKNMDLDSIKTNTSVQLDIIRFAFKPSSDSVFPVYIDIGKDGNDGYDKELQEKRMDVFEDDSKQTELYFNSTIQIAPIIPNPTSVLIRFMTKDDQYLWDIGMKGSIKLHNKIELTECKLTLTNDALSVSAQTNVFNIPIDAKLVISKQHIIAAIHISEVQIGNVIADIWKDCPPTLKTSLNSIDIKNIELLCQINRQNKNKTELHISAQINFKNMFEAIKEHIGLKSTILEIDVKHVFIRPSKDSSFPVYIDLKKPNKSDGKHVSLIDKIKNKPIQEQQSNEDFAIGFGATCTLKPLFEDMKATVLYTNNRAEKCYTIYAKIENVTTPFEDFIKLEYFEAFVSNQQMKFALQIKLFELVPVKVSVDITKKPYEIHGKCKTGKINIGEIMQKVLKCDDHILLDICKSVELRWLECEFWKTKKGTKVGLACRPAFSEGCCVVKFLKWIGLNLNELPIILYADPGDLSPQYWGLRMDSQLDVGFELSALTIKKLTWGINVKTNSFEAKASLLASLDLFGNIINIGGSISGTIYTNGTIQVQVTGTVDFTDGDPNGGLNPFALIGLNDVKIITLQQLFCSATLEVGTPPNGSIAVGCKCTLLGSTVTILIGLDLMTSLPSAMYVEIRDLSLIDIVHALGFTSFPEFCNVTLTKAIVALSTQDRTYDFSLLPDDSKPKAIEDDEQKENNKENKTIIEFQKGCYICAEIDLFELITLDVEMRISTTGYFLKVLIGADEENEQDEKDAVSVTEQLMQVVEDLEKYLTERIEVFKRKLTDAEEAIKREIDEIKKNLIWPLTWGCELAKGIVAGVSFVAKAVAEAILAIIRGFIALLRNFKLHFFKFVLDAGVEFKTEVHFKITFFEKLTVEPKFPLSISGKSVIKQVISQLFNFFKGEWGKYEEGLENDCENSATNAMKGVSGNSADDFINKMANATTEAAQQCAKDPPPNEHTKPPKTKYDDDSYPPPDEMNEEEREKEHIYKTETTKICEYFKNRFEHEFENKHVRCLVEEEFTYDDVEKKFSDIDADRQIVISKLEEQLD